MRPSASVLLTCLPTTDRARMRQRPRNVTNPGYCAGGVGYWVLFWFGWELYLDRLATQHVNDIIIPVGLF